MNDRFLVPKGIVVTRFSNNLGKLLTEEEIVTSKEAIYSLEDVFWQNSHRICFKLPEDAYPWTGFTASEREVEIL